MRDTLNLGKIPKPKLNIDFAKEVHNAVQRVLEGEDDALKLFVMLSKTEKIFKQAKEEVKHLAINEFEKYQEKTLEIYGVKVSKTGSGQYSYKNYDGWKKLDKERKKLEKQMKTAYSMMENGDIYVTTDGEEIPPATYTPNAVSLAIKY